MDNRSQRTICGSKRVPEEMMENRSGKRRLKMDRSMVWKCVLILKRLMTHPHGKHFNQPVDPIALNIPDYFSIVSNPMDLGTIKSKLVKDLYATTDEFEADVRLTFSNAVLYNPTWSPFHKMARRLDSIFSALSRFLGSPKATEKLKQESARGVARTCDLKAPPRTSGHTNLKAQKPSGGQRNKRFERQEVEAKGSRVFDSKTQRQREREAARMALEKMEKTVEFEDNISILRDFAHMMGDFSSAGPLGGYGRMYVPAKRFVNGKLKSPLESLGLYLKEEDDLDLVF